MQMLERLLPRLRHFRKSDDGQTLVLTALAMMSLLLMAGLGVDVGYLKYQRQQMQKAADAGALAAAAASIYGGNYTTAASNDTTANGFTPTRLVVGGLCSPTGSDICVAVNSPPQTPGDAFQGKAGYVEVIVAQKRPTFFMQVGGFGPVNVAARAVATTGANGSGCIFALDHNPTDPSKDDGDTLLIDGNVQVASNCGIYVDSSNSDALHKNGTSGNVSASYIGVVGDRVTNGNFQYQCTNNAPNAPCPATGIAQFDDPFRNVPSPTPAGGCQVPNGNNYPAGTYCNGIRINDSGTYNFGPGLITVQGPLTIGGGATVNGTGVLFYLTGPNYQGINIGGNVTVNWTAPTSGPQAGILFFQDRSICSPPTGNCSSKNMSSFNGTSGNNFSGAFYFPTTNLTYAGTPNLSDAAILIAWEIEFNGNAQLNDNLIQGTQSPLTTALLVE
jgi:hypothetical protein